MKAMTTPRLRCAIYTRKSTEEGLEQAFNSLDAQREACEAFILSQSSLGWKLVPDRYDDGGISGATMERPALQQLLQEIRDNSVDVVVVYKIDRLTRSLSDFARIVDVFDAANASFVSVTQQFNTTTSMGRLTLNVLLSFAQFEREVTAERIRDKIAASKQKGMWMGGPVPLGYRVEDRKLLVDEDQTEIVRTLFKRYLELGSVRALVSEANAGGVEARIGPSGSAQRITVPSNGSKPRRFSRGQLYHLLSNPIYAGKIRHRHQVYEGQHDAIVDPSTFAAAQELLALGSPRRAHSSNAADIHLLTGIVFDEEGNALRSVHTKKNNVRYRYYVSKRHVEERTDHRGGWRIPAKALEGAIEGQLDRLLGDSKQLSEMLRPLLPVEELAKALVGAVRLKTEYHASQPLRRRTIVRKLFPRIEIQTARLILHLDQHGFAEELVGGRVAYLDCSEPQRIVQLQCPFMLRRRGIETKMVLGDGSASPSNIDRRLVRLLVDAHAYLAQLADGSDRSISEIASANRIDRSDLARVLRLAFLAPSIVDRILNGTQPADLSAQKLMRLAELPHSWSEQEALLGY